jgi:hypothetical protein
VRLRDDSRVDHLRFDSTDRVQHPIRYMQGGNYGLGTTAIAWFENALSTPAAATEVTT